MITGNRDLYPAAGIVAPLARNAIAGLSARRPRRSAVATWKHQLMWFAAFLGGLVVLVAATCAAALWHVIAGVAIAQELDQARTQAAVDARLGVVDVERTLLQTISQDDPVNVRAAAVGSIAAAVRLEDAVSALRLALPGSAKVLEMRSLVEALKIPRMSVIMLARNGERVAASAALGAIALPLRMIDKVSSELLDEQAVGREQARRERNAAFLRLLYALVGAGALTAAASVVFYQRLILRFVPVEKLLQAVANSATELDAGGAQLDGVNRGVQATNQRLSVLLDRLRQVSQASTQDVGDCLSHVERLANACRASAALSRRHAAEAGAVVKQINTAAGGLHQLQETTHALSHSQGEIEPSPSRSRSLLRQRSCSR